MKKWQHKLHEIIYEADTFAGKLFDILLLIVILLSVILVSLESIASVDQVICFQNQKVQEQCSAPYVGKSACLDKLANLAGLLANMRSK